MTDIVEKHREQVESIIAPYQKYIAEQVKSLQSERNSYLFLLGMNTPEDTSNLFKHIFSLGILEIKLDELKEEHLKLGEEIIDRRKEIFFREKGIKNG